MDMVKAMYTDPYVSMAARTLSLGTTGLKARELRCPRTTHFLCRKSSMFNQDWSTLRIIFPSSMSPSIFLAYF